MFASRIARTLEVEPGSDDSLVVADGVRSPERDLAEFLLDIGPCSEKTRAVDADEEGLRDFEGSEMAKPVSASAVFVNREIGPAPFPDPETHRSSERVLVSLDAETARQLHPPSWRERESSMSLAPALRAQRPDRPAKLALDRTLGVDVDLGSRAVADRVVRLDETGRLRARRTGEREERNDRGEDDEDFHLEDPVSVDFLHCSSLWSEKHSLPILAQYEYLVNPCGIASGSLGLCVSKLPHSLAA